MKKLLRKNRSALLFCAFVVGLILTSLRLGAEVADDVLGSQTNNPAYAAGSAIDASGFEVEGSNEGDAHAELESGSAPPVAVTKIHLQDTYQAIRRFPGRINATQVTDVSFQVDGEIESVLVEVGDSVSAGDALANLDPERLQLRARELDAARAEAIASLKRAQVSLSRTTGLVDEGFATRQDLDNAIAERDGLQARVRQLKQGIENAKVNLNDATLKAPFSGVVVGRYLDSGSTVRAGQRVVRLNELGRLEALIGVPARFARNIEVGNIFFLESKDLSSKAKVMGIGDEVELSTQTVAIRLEVLEDPGFISGGLVRLQLEEIRQTRGAWAPALSLNESLRGLWSVYIVENVKNNIGVISRKDVEVIHVGNERIFVRGTIEDGDLVVSSAPFRFVPGQQVMVVNTNTAIPSLP
ncbi:MAG: efflux RND transporter periplasmic adaptor subunit [Pseudomonadota bacterium]